MVSFVIPVDRPPFPLAKNVEVPVYFTAQPGGTYVAAPGGAPNGEWLVYPNYRNAIADQRVQFFHYDPDVRGWYVYGTGRVTPNATQVVPDPSTRFYAFTGAMIINLRSLHFVPTRNLAECSDEGYAVNDDGSDLITRARKRSAK